MALVKVGCKLPHGLVIELGYTIGDGKGKGIDIVKGDNYRAVRLNGTNSNLVAGAAATAHQAPGITMVEEAVIKEWLERNKKLGFVKTQMIYIIANDAEGAAIAIDQSKMKTGFEPLTKKDEPKAADGTSLIERDDEAGATSK